MFIIKRDGRSQAVHFDKITSRIKKLCYGLNESFVDPIEVSQKVANGVYKGCTTSELDELSAETCAQMNAKHPDYGILAARIAMSNLHKSTQKSFVRVMTDLYRYIEPRTQLPAPMIDKNVYDFIMANQEKLSSVIVYDRDYSYDYFGFQTLKQSYLLKIGGKIVERPQHMLMRVSCGIHTGNVDAVIETYNLMSQGSFTHASPTLFNGGTTMPQLSSCFLLQIQSDSLKGIYNTLTQCAMISKASGGIGLSVHDVRASGSYIRGTNGTSDGIIPMLRVFNNTGRYVNQSGKRKGAISIYLEPHHADIYEFLKLRSNQGNEEMRCRDLFLGLWVSDLFMQRVQSNGSWPLFCPSNTTGLSESWGKRFEKRFLQYEKEGKAVKVVEARDLWSRILDAQAETGTPYLLYKDACNRKSNQQNLGTIKSSNLCTEIVQFTSKNEIAVCNLASIALPAFVSDGKFNHQQLYQVTQTITRNLNKVIDVNYYPVKQAKNSNQKHRPIGIGVQGLADLFLLLRLPFDSLEARKLNKEIFETMYFAALSASCDLAQEQGPYSSYMGSPISKGLLQFDLWSKEKLEKEGKIHADTDEDKDRDRDDTSEEMNFIYAESKNHFSGRWDWTALRLRILQHGVRNSLLLAPMPTASTSQILGWTEAFEPITNNLYVRRTLAGEFIRVNKHLLSDLIQLGLWNPVFKNKLIAHNGSVQKLDVPQNIKDLYRTVWEIPQKHIIEMAADRAVFIDQSQSMNIHMQNPNYAKLTSMHFYAWKSGLKTGLYYLRTKPSTDAIKFTVDEALLRQEETKKVELESQKEPKGKTLFLTSSTDSIDSLNGTTSPSNGIIPTPSSKEQDFDRQEALICRLKKGDACESCGS